jgi:hypothetical protein
MAMNTIRQTIVCSAGALLVALLAAPASAQIPRYMPPAGNPLPNALNYFRNDTGILDPYNAFVAPRRQLDYQLRATQSQMQQNQRRLQRELDQIRESGAAPTGIGAGFMNHGAYFMQNRPYSGRR